MRLNKYRLEDFIELYSKKCNIANLTIYQVSGINKDKEFFEPSKQVGGDTSAYKIVPPNYFACNLMHVGRDISLPISMNHSSEDKYVSPAYSVFRIINEEIILKDYFFMLLKSDEKDRFFWFNTDSSVRDGMSWNDFCSLEISLPDIEIQQKYVDIYKAMLENQKSYERGTEDLKLVCDGYIEELRRKNKSEEIGKYITECNEKNKNLSVTLNQGIDVNMQFIPAKREAKDKENNRIVRSGQFAFNKVIKCNGTKLPIALRSGEDCIISNSYQTFEVLNTEQLIPEYLMMWMSRSETQRYCGFSAWGSTRDVFSFDELKKLKFPIPKIEIQQDIVNIYNEYVVRKKINENLKVKLKEICPILIRGSIEEAKLS